MRYQSPADGIIERLGVQSGKQPVPVGLFPNSRHDVYQWTQAVGNGRLVCDSIEMLLGRILGPDV